MLSLSPFLYLCLTSEEGGRALCLQGCGRALSLPLSLTSKEGVCQCALCLQGYAHPLHRSDKEREKERGREKVRVNVRKRERDM